MFIKKARFYKVVGEFKAVTEGLKAFRFQPMMPGEKVKSGFSMACGSNLIHEANGHQLVVLREDRKLLPSDVVKSHASAVYADFEREKGRPPSRKEKMQITEDIEVQLLPQAFVKSKYTHAIITKNGYLVVNGSASEAETVMALLRKAMGSLPAIGFAGYVLENPEFELTQLIKGEKETELFEVGSEFEFYGATEEAVTLKFKGLDVKSDEVQGATAYGLTGKVGLSSRHGICFTIKDDCSLNGIQWANSVQERAEGDDKDALFDSAFFIAAETFSAVIDDLVELFGGVRDDYKNK